MVGLVPSATGEDRVVSAGRTSFSLALPLTQPPSIWEAYLAQPWQCRTGRYCRWISGRAFTRDHWNTSCPLTSSLYLVPSCLERTGRGFCICFSITRTGLTSRLRVTGQPSRFLIDRSPHCIWGTRFMRGFQAAHSKNW